MCRSRESASHRSLKADTLPPSIRSNASDKGYTKGGVDTFHILLLMSTSTRTEESMQTAYTAMASHAHQRTEEHRLKRNIYIIGAQSTGKTTLVAALATHFAHENTETASIGASPTPFQLKEVARNVLRKHNFTAHDITSSKTRALELQRLIINAQAIAEAALDGIWYISDRSALDAVVYARQYVGAQEAESLMHEESWQALEDRMRAGLVVICEPGGQWLTDDGVRLMPRDREEWFQLHEHFLVLLDRLKMAYAVLPCDVAGLDDRVDYVLNEWTRNK